MLNGTRPAGHVLVGARCRGQRRRGSAWRNVEAARRPSMDTGYYPMRARNGEGTPPARASACLSAWLARAIGQCTSASIGQHPCADSTGTTGLGAYSRAETCVHSSSDARDALSTQKVCAVSRPAAATVTRVLRRRRERFCAPTPRIAATCHLGTSRCLTTLFGFRHSTRLGNRDARLYPRAAVPGRRPP